MHHYNTRSKTKQEKKLKASCAIQKVRSVNAKIRARTALLTVEKTITTKKTIKCEFNTVPQIANWTHQDIKNPNVMSNETIKLEFKTVPHEVARASYDVKNSSTMNKMPLKRDHKATQKTEIMISMSEMLDEKTIDRMSESCDHYLATNVAFLDLNKSSLDVCVVQVEWNEDAHGWKGAHTTSSRTVCSLPHKLKQSICLEPKKMVTHMYPILLTHKNSTITSMHTPSKCKYDPFFSPPSPFFLFEKKGRHLHYVLSPSLFFFFSKKNRW